MDIFLLDKKKQLVISAAISFVANSIVGSIIHIAFKMNNQVRKNYQYQISMQ